MKPAALASTTTLILCLSLHLPAQTAPSATPTQPTVSFLFDRPGVPVPHYLIHVQQDGTGTYQADIAQGISSASSMRVESAQHVDRPITLSSATTAKIFKAAHELKHFNVACASKAKNIADTGAKTLTYSGPDATGTCTFNFSENKNVVMLTDTFQGIAETLDEGRRIDFLHRYDRLGLDAEMDTLTQEVAAGRAIELAIIAPALTAVTTDEALIERVRQRAQKLLEQAKEK
jgi:hypothetical protein